jgi:hypothetical protein
MFGMKIKFASPTPHTLFFNVLDGSISDLHTAESCKQGSYEVDIDPLAKRYQGRLQASCEKIAMDVTGEILEPLWN